MLNVEIKLEALRSIPAETIPEGLRELIADVLKTTKGVESGMFYVSTDDPVLASFLRTAAKTHAEETATEASLRKQKQRFKGAATIAYHCPGCEASHEHLIEGAFGATEAEASSELLSLVAAKQAFLSMTGAKAHLVSFLVEEVNNER